MGERVRDKLQMQAAHEAGRAALGMHTKRTKLSERQQH